MRRAVAASVFAITLAACGGDDAAPIDAASRRSAPPARAPKYDVTSRTEPAAIERQAVASSNLRSVGYDAGSSTLEIEFHSGGVYRYADVPVAEYRGLMAAESKGRYFNAQIKNGGYAYRRIR